jgi:hypothetical membrane protein
MGITQARFWRRIYLIICLLLGAVTPLVCWYMIPDFNPIEKPLSYFGVVAHTSFIWNATLLVLAVGIYLNAQASFKAYFRKRRYRRFLRVLLWAAVCFLFLTAIVDMEHSLIHKLSAALFFITYNFFVFCFGLLRSLKYVRKGLFSVVIGSLMLLSSLLLLPFPSYGVFEIAYLSLILYWNSILLYNRVERENRLFSTHQKEANSVGDNVGAWSLFD